MYSSAGDPGLAGGSAPPEAALQLALDLTSLDDAAALVARLAPRLSRIEIGTPLALAAGFAAIGIVGEGCHSAGVVGHGGCHDTCVLLLFFAQQAALPRRTRRMKLAGLTCVPELSTTKLAGSFGQRQSLS